MDVSVDAGPNITSLLERLATQIGITVDKVFPWYVQQAQLEGTVTVVAILVALLVFGVAFTLSVRKADYKDGNFAAVLSVFTGIALGVSVLLVPLSGLDGYLKTVNPNYYAMKMLTHDLGQLSARR